MGVSRQVGRPPGHTHPICYPPETPVKGEQMHTEICWTCQHCNTEIPNIDGAGWIQTTPQHSAITEWEVTCERCDTNQDATYAIDIVRINTLTGIDGLNNWTNHLNKKTWANPDNWQHIIDTYATITP